MIFWYNIYALRKKQILPYKIYFLPFHGSVLKFLKIAAYSQINFHQSKNRVVAHIYVPKQQNNFGTYKNK